MNAAAEKYEVSIPVAGAMLTGELTVPFGAHGLVIFAHGSGSSRFSPRNQLVAKILRDSGLATLLFDLLTTDEEAVDNHTRQYRFDIQLLANRLVRAVEWAIQQPSIRSLSVGLFGASTGAAAALIAASRLPETVQAVVSRGGRPDLAGPFLSRVMSPVLLIVGGCDTDVIRLNDVAYAQLENTKAIEIVPGASHLFEEPGTLKKLRGFPRHGLTLTWRARKQSKRSDTMWIRFEDRREAGEMLAKKLRSFRGRDDVVILALPRGGVPVGFEVASELGLPLDVLVVRKLGIPGHEELAFGAIASGGYGYIDKPLVRALKMPESMIEEITQRETRELIRRESLYRGQRKRPMLTGKVVILIDDGLATGSTMRSAVHAVRSESAKEIIVAAPVCSRQTCEALQNGIDTWCLCVEAPEPFYAVGFWYRNFDQTTDEEVQRLLAESRKVVEIRKQAA
jgi:predicted phosphoribosyltransferase/dienelactone hydrolase